MALTRLSPSFGQERWEGGRRERNKRQVVERKGRWKKKREKRISNPSQHTFHGSAPHSQESLDTLTVVSSESFFPKAIYLIWLILSCDFHSQLYPAEYDIERSRYLLAKNTESRASPLRVPILHSILGP